MSDHAVGKIFVELDLDPSRYTKSQQKLLKDATQTTLSIEENFKKLGIKTSAEYNLMRAKIENAYAGITHSAQATANDILRAEQAKNKQLQQLNDEQFGKQRSLISTLKEHWIAATAIIAGAIGTAMKAWDLAQMAADYAEQKGILDNLATKYDTTADQILGSMQKASDGLVANADLMKAALGGIAKGLAPQQMIELAEAARVLGDTVGDSATTALNNLSEALETGRTRSLKKYLGTVVDLESMFGDLYEALTETEKAQALYSITMIQSEQIQSRMTKAVDESADKMERMEASYNNAKITVGNFFKVVIGGTYDIVRFLAVENTETLSLKRAEAATRNHSLSIREKTIALKEAVTPYQKEIDALKKIVAERNKEEKAHKAVNKEAERSIKLREKEAAKIEELQGVIARINKEQRWDIIDLKTAEEELINTEMSRIEEIRSGGHIVGAIVAQESDDFSDLFNGIRSGYNDSLENAYTWAQGGRDIFNSFANDASTALSSNLFDVIHGDLSDLGAAWKTFWDSMLQQFTDIIAKMVLQWALSGLANLSINLGFSGVGGAIASAAGTTAATTAAATGAGVTVGTTGAAAAGASGGAATTSGITGTAASAGAVAAGAALSGIGLETISDLLSSSARWSQHGIAYDANTGSVTMEGFNTSNVYALSNTTSALSRWTSVLDASGLSDLIAQLDTEAYNIHTYTKGQGADSGVLDAILSDALSDYLSAYRQGSAIDISKYVDQSALDWWRSNSNYTDYDPETGMPTGWVANYGNFGGGKKYGGISRGPKSGYLELLHGEEAVIPLKDGAVPVTMKGGGGQVVFNFPNALVVDKNAVMELAELIYPYTKKLEAWGH